MRLERDQNNKWNRTTTVGGVDNVGEQGNVFWKGKRGNREHLNNTPQPKMRNGSKDFRTVKRIRFFLPNTLYPLHDSMVPLNDIIESKTNTP